MPDYDFSRGRDRAQSEKANSPPFKRDCHQWTFPPADADLARRKATKPATSEPAATAAEVMVLAWPESE